MTNSYIYFNSLYLKLLVSQSKLAGIRIDILKYKLSEMNFVFEISRVDCISKENCYSHFSIKLHLNNLKPPAPFSHFFSARKTLSTIYKSMYFVWFPSIQLISHSLSHVDHLTGGLL